MTIENLAVMVQKGFKELKDEMVSGFKDVDKRFDDVDKRLTNLEGDVSYLKARVEEIGRTLGKHSDELEDINKKLDSFTDPKNKNRFVTYREFVELESRVAAFEKKLLSK